MNILKHFITIGISSALNMLISLITTPIITRIVDPADMGSFSIFTSYVGIFTSFLYFGLNDTFCRFFFSYKDLNKKRGLLKFCFLIPLYISLITSVIAIILFKFKYIKLEYSFLIFVLLCINIVLTIWNAFSNEMLQNTKKSKMYSISMLSQRIVYCFTAILFISIFKSNHLLILVLATTLSTFISSAIGTLATKEYWNFSEAEIPTNKNEITKYSIPIYVYFIIFSVYDVLDKLLVEYYCNEYEVGIYSSAFALVGIFAIVQNAFNVIWRPTQTEKYTNTPDDRTFIKNGNKYMTIIVFFIGVCTILLKDVLCLLLGEKYRVGAQIIPFLIFNPIMNILIGTVTSGIEYSKKSYLRTIIIFISLVFELFLSAFLIPKFASKGAAISMALSLIIQYILTMHFSNKYYPIDYGFKKSLILIVGTFIYATVNAFYYNTLLNIVLFAIMVVIIIAIYKKDIIYMWDYTKQSLFLKSK